MPLCRPCFSFFLAPYLAGANRSKTLARNNLPPLHRGDGYSFHNFGTCWPHYDRKVFVLAYGIMGVLDGTYVVLLTPRRSALRSAGTSLAAVMLGQPSSAKQTGTTVVDTVDALMAAVDDPAMSAIVVGSRIAGVPQLRLRKGQALLGRDGAEIQFSPGIDGLCLSTDNTMSGLNLLASQDRRAVFNDTAVPTLGRFRLSGLQTTGQVQILVRGRLRSVVEAADVFV